MFSVSRCDIFHKRVDVRSTRFYFASVTTTCVPSRVAPCDTDNRSVNQRISETSMRAVRGKIVNDLLIVEYPGVRQDSHATVRIRVDVRSVRN